MSRIKLSNLLSLIVAAGLRALALAKEMGLGPKLPEGLLETLESNLTSLSALIPGTDDARTGVHALTGLQMDACRRAVRRIAAVRRAVVRQTKSLNTRRSYGVGERLSLSVVRDIVHALNVVIERIESHPDEAKSFGFGESHLATLRTLRDEVVAVDSDQEKARVSRPLSTRDRNAMARRVAKAVGLISDLGTFEFADDDAVRVQFEALVSRTPKAAASPRDEAAEPPAAEAAAGK